MYEIEKNIPIPSNGPRRPKQELRLALEQMEVGDSIVVPSHEVRRKAYGSAKGANIGIRSRVEGDHIRIWRIK